MIYSFILSLILCTSSLVFSVQEQDIRASAQEVAQNLSLNDLDSLEPVLNWLAINHRLSMLMLQKNSYSKLLLQEALAIRSASLNAAPNQEGQAQDASDYYDTLGDLIRALKGFPGLFGQIKVAESSCKKAIEDYFQSEPIIEELEKSIQTLVNSIICAHKDDLVSVQNNYHQALGKSIDQLYYLYQAHNDIVSDKSKLPTPVGFELLGKISNSCDIARLVLEENGALLQENDQALVFLDYLLVQTMQVISIYYLEFYTLATKDSLTMPKRFFKFTTQETDLLPATLAIKTN